MFKNTLDADTVRRMFLAGAKNLELHKEWINELNVFPVPDGDTGTNMTLTIMSAVHEVENLNEVTMQSLAKAISSGSLRGARGNSGVIMSQLFRGLTKEIKDLEELDKTAVANAMQRATETAYKAVMKPKEGTILTVAKGMSEKARELVSETSDMEGFLRQIIEHGEKVLAYTPELLPVLKEAGVVDSGGQGLIQVVKGALEGYLGEETRVESAAEKKTEVREKTPVEEIQFGYCTEFFIRPTGCFADNDEIVLRHFLESVGDSVALVRDEDIIKIHVHTNDPGLVLQRGLSYGSLSRIKIDNMKEEAAERNTGSKEDPSGFSHEETRIEAQKEIAEYAQAAEEEDRTELPRRPAGFVVVSIGEGMNEIFRGLNVDEIIEGGQTMNPSTEDVLLAAEKVNADVVYVFPNNKNIILAAQQAADLVEGKKIIVIPSCTVPQGITAIINYSPSRSTEENVQLMTEEMQHVRTGQVTYAVRNTSIDDKQIHEGDIMGIGDSGLLAVGVEISGVTETMIDAMVGSESELISIYYGQEISRDAAEALRSAVADKYAECDVEMHFGGQPIYYYVVSVE